MTIWEIISLTGGVGLFLYGMTVMSSGLKSAAGDRLRVILEKVTGYDFERLWMPENAGLKNRSAD